jgi:hypothetical protein
MSKRIGLLIAALTLFFFASPVISPAQAKSSCVYRADGRLVCGQARRSAYKPRCNCPHYREQVGGYYSYRPYYDRPFNYYRSYYSGQPYYYQPYYYQPYYYAPYETFSMEYDYPFREYQIPYYRNPW